MSLTGPPRVFLSYARRDGEDFATALRRRLAREQPEITLWQDRTELEGGVNFWAQIEAALDQVRFLVVVLTPCAIASDMTQKEWRYARQRGVNVYPVKGATDAELKYEALPNWMRKTHICDIGQWTGDSWENVKEWDTFVSYLKSDRQPPRAQFLAPDLPPDFVPRPREFDLLVQSLLAPDRRQPTTITTALHGAGGYGKTTLAIALCHDQRIREAFDDGVLWTSLGRSPSVLDELKRWYDALTGSRPAFLDEAEAAVKVAEKLGERQYLLVIDDVWDRKHLEPFLKGGANCVRVVTTRRLDLLEGAPRVCVDLMTAAEAERLVRTAVGTLAVPAHRLAGLVWRLGECPLLLKLAAGMLRRLLDRGDTSDGALTYVEQLLDKYGVVAFDARDPTGRDAAVTRTVMASRAELKEQEPADDRRLQELAVFPEDTAIPLTTLERLWGTDYLDTVGCAHRLDNVALLKLDLRRRAVSLHDVMRDYLVRQSDVTTVHAQLVAAYGDPLELPDTYAWRWLPYHLQHAGLRDQLRTLLLRPEWLDEQRRRVGPYAQLTAFEHVSHDIDLELVGRTLRLAIPVLARDPSQFCEQMLARLPAERSRTIDQFRDRLRDAAPVPRLHARWPNLVGSGSLQQTLPHGNAVDGALRLPNGLVLSFGTDGTLWVWDIATGEGCALNGHNGRVNGALLLPDSRVLSWSDDGTLRVWDVATGQGRALTGHDGGVNGALLLPDGRILSWSADRTLRVWNVATGEGSALTGHEGRVNGALMLLDGRVLSWSDDGTLRVWDVATGEGRVLTGDQGPVEDALLLPDGRVLSWRWDGTMWLWNVATGEGGTLTGHHGRVNGALLLQDGRLLSWGADQTLRVWDAATGAGRALTGHDSGVFGALQLPDGRILSWSGDSTLRVWDAATGVSRALIGHDRNVTGALLLADGRVLSWSADRTLRVWDVATGVGRALAGHEGRVNGALLLADERVLSWSDDGTLRVWDLATAQGRTLTGHDERVDGVLVLPDGRVLSWSRDGTLQAWDAATGEGRALISHHRAVEGALLLPDGRVLSWSGDGTLRVWDVTTGKGHVLGRHHGTVKGALLLPDGRAVSWSSDRTLRVWDVATGEGRTLTDHDELDGALLLRNGRVLSWGGDKTLWVWDVATGERRALMGHQGRVTGALLLPDNRVLSWSADLTLRVWNVATATWRALTMHDGWVKGALLLPDGRVLSWSTDRTLRVCDVATGEERVLIGHDDSVNGALLLPDGCVLSWSRDGTLRVWDMATGATRALVGGHDGGVGCALLLPDGRVLSWGADRCVRRQPTKSEGLSEVFYVDGQVTVAVSLGTTGERFFVGDSLGRVHFLEVVTASSHD